MPRVTKKDLEKKIEDRDKLIDMLSKQINKLQQEKEDILNNKGAVSKAEFQGAIKEIERLKINYKTVSELYDKSKEKNSTLINKCTELAKENKELKENRIEKKHNERGAGRKSKLTDEQLQKIKMLYQNGKSYGSIAKEVGLSKAYVYKLINKQ
ncbi:helix-turn-helix domain-containing protein [Clostridium aestuarii]|uniref:Helix-turn-helix domain-containing protein n=1 Tax=Clostridium aestuarii TaxID=338193 RepID=A0ABT4D3S1_9CLOT|nr:helix-turn-helix domain-containing protein [Clostridium aestuarii]MCY6485899.1 helix-turn-helix domain-containing protein [Clostridium aestuarii]